MHIHRSRPKGGFTVLPNGFLQDRRLSYTARGLLADLLSRPDGWSEDGRRMADTSPQGRLAVAKALRELAAFGYYRVNRIRRADGTCVSEVHVYDTPQPPPNLTRPGSGALTAGDPGANPVKNRGKVPTLPAPRRPVPEGEGGRERSSGTGPDRDRATAPFEKAVTTLFRAIRAEPRLRLGAAEALTLAPLVVPWLERGCDHRHLAEALVPGLPARIHSTAALLRDRLTRKLPPAPESSPLVRPRWNECISCGRPTPTPTGGVCRVCAGPDHHPAEDTAERARTAANGRARVRAALLGPRSG